MGRGERWACDVLNHASLLTNTYFPKNKSFVSCFHIIILCMCPLSLVRSSPYVGMKRRLITKKKLMHLQADLQTDVSIMKGRLMSKCAFRKFVMCHGFMRTSSGREGCGSGGGGATDMVVWKIEYFPVTIPQIRVFLQWLGSPSSGCANGPQRHSYSYACYTSLQLITYLATREGEVNGEGKYVEGGDVDSLRSACKSEMATLAL